MKPFKSIFRFPWPLWWPQVSLIDFSKRSVFFAVVLAFMHTHTYGQGSEKHIEWPCFYRHHKHILTRKPPRDKINQSIWTPRRLQVLCLSQATIVSVWFFFCCLVQIWLSLSPFFYDPAAYNIQLTAGIIWKIMTPICVLIFSVLSGGMLLSDPFTRS